MCQLSNRGYSSFFTDQDIVTGEERDDESRFWCEMCEMIWESIEVDLDRVVGVVCPQCGADVVEV